LIKDTNTYLA
jgi:cysteinyl-tRNA synthetase